MSWQPCTISTNWSISSLLSRRMAFNNQWPSLSLSMKRDSTGLCQKTWRELLRSCKRTNSRWSFQRPTWWDTSRDSARKMFPSPIQWFLSVLAQWSSTRLFQWSQLLLAALLDCIRLCHATKQMDTCKWSKRLKTIWLQSLSTMEFHPSHNQVQLESMLDLWLSESTTSLRVTPEETFASFLIAHMEPTLLLQFFAAWKSSQSIAMRKVTLSSKRLRSLQPSTQRIFLALWSHIHQLMVFSKAESERFAILSTSMEVRFIWMEQI